MAHIQHLLPAYVHRQLSRRQRDQVWQHIQDCPQCYTAYLREQDLARDLKAKMPAFGQPSRGQLARLWPAVWQEINTPPRPIRLSASPFGLALMMAMMTIFVVSAMISAPVTAVAAPFGAAPTQVLITPTTARTGEPTLTQVAAVNLLPLASPHPVISRYQDATATP